MDHAKTPEESDILPYPVTASRLQVESQNLAITHKSKASAIDERGFIIGYPVNTTPESPA